MSESLKELIAHRDEMEKEITDLKKKILSAEETGMMSVSHIQVRRSARLNGGLAQSDDDASLSSLGALGAMRNHYVAPLCCSTASQQNA